MKVHKFAETFPMMDKIDFENLKRDIKENGFDETRAIILFEDTILDGRNRFKACNELGIKPKFMIYEGNNPLSYVISNNLDRRHLTTSQRAAVGIEILPLLEEEAKKRMLAGTPTQKIGEGKHKGESAEQVAKQFHTNREYIAKGKKLKDEQPEVFEEIKKGTKNFSDVKKEERLAKIKKQREDIEKEVLTKPTGLFDVIVIDPPWKYDGDIYKELKDGLPAYAPQGFRGSSPYPTMNLEEIGNIKLPVKDDCVLWLWTTNVFLLKMQQLLDIWGFELKSILTWDKEHFGTGRWLRSQTEHCILAIKGKPYFNNTKWATIIKEKRTTHSTKPEIFYKMVDEICAGRKLDYFARKERKGWEVYGDEVNSTIKLQEVKNG